MSAAVEPRKERKRKHWRWSAYLTGLLFLVLLSLPTADDRDGEGSSYVIGYVFARVAIILALALLVRAAYVKLIRRDDRAIVSPWIFAIAVPVALVLAAGRAAGS